MKHLLLLLTLAACLALGTGCDQSGPQPDPVPDPPGPTPEPAGEAAIYLASESGQPVAVPRDVTDSDPEALAAALIEELLAGPTASEQDQGLESFLPSGVRLLSVRMVRPVLELDFSSEMEQLDSSRSDTALEQLALTVIRVSGVGGVRLMVEGECVVCRVLPPLDDPGFLADLDPEAMVDLFIASIPDSDAMWQLLGPTMQGYYSGPDDPGLAEFEEGLGSWSDYRVEEVAVSGDEAHVTIAGEVTREGMTEDARQTLRLVRIGGYWRYEGAGN